MRRLDALRARAAELRAQYPWVNDPEHDARLSAENAPFRDMQWWDPSGTTDAADATD